MLKEVTKTFQYVLIVFLVQLCTGLVAIPFLLWMLSSVDILTTFSYTIIFIIFLSLILFLFQFMEHLLFPLKTAHIAVLVSLFKMQPLPPTQLSYGLSEYRKVKDANLKLLIHAFLKESFNFLSIPFFKSMVFAHLFLKPNYNTWISLRDGVILLYRNKDSLQRKIRLLLIINYSFLLAFVILFYFLQITNILVVPTRLKEIPLLLSIFVFLLLKFSILDQLIAVASILFFFRTIKNQNPDPMTMQKLESRFAAFSQILAHAGKQIQFDPALQQLLPFVQQYFHQGWSKDQIKQTLLAKGWPENSIETALDSF
ncbi:hypothetical protein J4457_03975 [Candidatus Woesearchaeota archaeon]|nr:hypothetical protein [Candidatus Woesearchaeota archaeon]